MKRVDSIKGVQPFFEKKKEPYNEEYLFLKNGEKKQNQQRKEEVFTK